MVWGLGFRGLGQQGVLERLLKVPLKIGGLGLRVWYFRFGILSWQVRFKGGVDRFLLMRFNGL